MGQESGFYYVGRDQGHILKLLEAYQQGYASEELKNAKSDLLRSLEQSKGRSPELIFCGSGFDLRSICRFSEFLRKHPVFKSIPFVIDGSGLTEGEIQEYKRQARPDEILFLWQTDVQTLDKKVSFLRKVKARNEAEGAHRIEEGRWLGDWRPGAIIKRAFDILVASLVLLLLFPLMAIIAIAIKLESAGPVFYIAKRAGRGYRIFNFYKFRTMVDGADKRIAEVRHLNQYDPRGSGPMFFKMSDDPRITKVGKFLRNTSLDEIPQLVNVLRGDMSLVGNRPLPLYEAQMLTTDSYAARFLAPAGITGLWQVKKRGNKEMSIEERIRIDIDYATNCNLLTDFWIIASTPSALMQKENV